MYLRSADNMTDPLCGLASSLSSFTVPVWIAAAHTKVSLKFSNTNYKLNCIKPLPFIPKKYQYIKSYVFIVKIYRFGNKIEAAFIL